MKAAIYQGAGKPLSLETVEDPSPGPCDVVIKIGRCGICGSDVSTITTGSWGYPVGTVLGHEYCGEVVEVGSQVETLNKGDLITALPATGCGKCEVCRSGNYVICPNKTSRLGGFAEYARVPAEIAIKLPSSYSAADGALIEPFSVGLYGAEFARIRPGDRVLVLGGGVVALTSTFWARRLGAGRIVALSRSDKRAPLLRAAGADVVLPFGDDEGREVAEAFGGPPDIVFECIGAPGMTARAVKHVKPLGKIIALGACTEADPLIPAVAGMKCVHIAYPIGYTLRNFRHAADALEADVFDAQSLISSVVPLENIEVALDRLRAPNGETKIHISTV